MRPELRVWLSAHARAINGKAIQDPFPGAQGITELDVSDADLVEIPEFVSDLRKLRRLNLARNPLTEVPEWVWDLTDLRELALNRTAISGLSPRVGRLRKLEQLTMSRCEVHELPEEVGELRQLRTLNVRNNLLTTLPESVGRLRRLYELDASENHLTALPESIGGLQELRNLYVSGNALSTVTSAVARCAGLESLALSGNKLSEIPHGILALPRLKTLWLYDNPLRDPPVEIAERGVEAVRVWLSAIERGTGEADEDVRLLIVGPGRVGKTSLVDRVVSDRHRRKVGRTPSVTIVGWPRGERRTVQLWDFGGQDHLVHAHRLFLARRAGAVLVLDASSAQDIDYWLRLVAPAALPRSVVVVLNKIDKDEDLDVDRRSVVKKWPTVSAFARVSCRTGAGIEELLDQLDDVGERMAAALPPIPDSWRHVRLVLRRDGRERITVSDFAVVCENSGVRDSDEQSVLLDYLVDTGRVIVVRAGNQQAVVLDPRWILDAVYRIFGSRTIKSLGGRVHSDAIAAVLDGTRYDRAGGDLITSALVAHDLAFRDGEFVVLPSMLPDRRPPLDEPPDEAVRMSVRLEYLPPFFLGRLLARIGADASVAWRRGARVTSQNGSEHGEVSFDSETRVVELLAWGDTPRDLMSVLRHKVGELADEEGVGRQEVVVLSGGGSIPFAALLAHESAGQEELFDVVTRLRHDVGQLLSGRKTMKKRERPTQNVNVHGGHVSFGDHATHVSWSADAQASIAALVQALAASSLETRHELISEVEAAETTGDPKRLRAASLAALDAGAKIATVANAANNLLNGL